MPYHKQIDIPFALPPKWGRQQRWIKGDMVNAVGYHRADLLRLGKDRSGRRIYQYKTLSAEQMGLVERCVLHGMGFSALTKHLKNLYRFGGNALVILV